MPKNVCSVIGCNNLIFGRGLCRTHYHTIAQDGEIGRKRTKRGTRQQHKLAYNSYIAMLSRCYQSYNPSYGRYGGKGIKVCKRWLSPCGFQHFLDDMGDRRNNESLDRIDSDGDYCPENCRWTTVKNQNRNRKTNIYYTYLGKTAVLTDWAHNFNLNPNTVFQRYHRGERGDFLFRPSLRKK